MDAQPVLSEVWWAQPEAPRPGLLALLDAAEQERHARFRLAADRGRYLAAHALARLACARAAQCRPEEVAFTRYCPHCSRGGDHGKPRPAGAAQGLQMSLSHSGEHVAVAVARGTDIGLDVEQVRRRAHSGIDGLADYVLTESERAAWRELPAAARDAAFFTYWTRKEALLKATGAGIGGGLNRIAVSAPDEPPAVLDWKAPNAPEAVRLADLAAGPGYRAALAALSGSPVRAVHFDGAALLAAAAD